MLTETLVPEQIHGYEQYSQPLVILHIFSCVNFSWSHTYLTLIIPAFYIPKCLVYSTLHTSFQINNILALLPKPVMVHKAAMNISTVNFSFHLKTLLKGLFQHLHSFLNVSIIFIGAENNKLSEHQVLLKRLFKVA